MAIFVRKADPPQFRDYRSHKPYLKLDFRRQCAYCGITEGYLNGADAFGENRRGVPAVQLDRMLAIL